MSSESTTEVELSGLAGMVVVSKRHGVGKIKNIDPKRVSIDMWVCDPRYPEKTDPLLFRKSFDLMTDPDRTLSWGFITDVFLDNEGWDSAPDQDSLVDMLTSIESSKSAVIIHTSNPPKPYEHVEKIKLEMKEHAKARSEEYDHDLIKTLDFIKVGVDRALDAFIMRQRESDAEYFHRLSSLKEAMSDRAFSDVIFSSMDEVWQDALAEEIAFLGAVVCLSQDSDPRDTLFDILDRLEKRICLHINIIDSFTKTYNESWLRKMINRGGPTTRIG